MVSFQEVYRASATAPVNIAVVKYWGKRSTILNLPTNSSLSVTLCQSDLCTHTTASCSPSFDDDTLHLNNEQGSLNTGRTGTCVSQLRTSRKLLEKAHPELPKISTLPLRVVSRNNFPTAAGLASSAAGFAALVCAISRLYELPLDERELSKIARQGSGSACRSLYGGFVKWNKGDVEDGSDSFAEQVVPPGHWADMHALIIVVSSAKKSTSSTEGMKATVATSTLFPARAEYVVPWRIANMEKAIQEKDFETFARLTMAESNSFHAICLDTEPPVFYLNGVSQAVIHSVERINERAGCRIAAYTFDAGPNAVIFYLEKDRDAVAGVFKSILNGKNGWQCDRGRAVREVREAVLEEATASALRDGVQNVILTAVGEGAIGTESHLADDGLF